MTRAHRWTLIAAILGSGIVFLDGTVVALALKQIGEDLPATFLGVFEGQTYVQSGYFAVLAALLIIAGALSDAYGRRRIFVIGLVGFGASSVLCGLAPTLELLVVARVLQGAAGALLVPGSLAVITATFEGPARTRAFGQWAAATSGMKVSIRTVRMSSGPFHRRVVALGEHGAGSIERLEQTVDVCGGEDRRGREPNDAVGVEGVVHQHSLLEKIQDQFACGLLVHQLDPDEQAGPADVAYQRSAAVGQH